MALKRSAFLETIIAFLMPYFLEGAMDIAEARTEILSTLEAYATRTRAEFLLAAKIIALGMTTLDVLADAKSLEMSPSMRIRHRGCANSLNRSTIQVEKALDRRLACDLPMAPEPRKDPVTDAPAIPPQTIPPQAIPPQAAHAQAAIQPRAAAHHAQATTDTGNRPSAGHPIPAEERSKQMWAGARIDTLTQMGIPAQGQPAPDAGPAMSR